MYKQKQSLEVPHNSYKSSESPTPGSTAAVSPGRLCEAGEPGSPEALRFWGTLHLYRATVYNLYILNHRTP